MTVPDYLPTLSVGSHKDPATGACVMEYVSVLAGEDFSDKPTTVHPGLTMLAWWTNDVLGSGDRDEIQKLLPLATRFLGTAKAVPDCEDAFTGYMTPVDGYLAMWAAEYLDGFADIESVDVPAMCALVRHHLDTGEPLDHGHILNQVMAMKGSWALTGQTVRSAPGVFLARQVILAEQELFNPFISAHRNINGQCLYGFITTGLMAAGYAGGAPAVIDMLVGLLDEFDRITGHTPSGVTPVVPQFLAPVNH